MNTFYNIQIPEFYEKYGSDWEAFTTIIEENTDYFFKKILELYCLVDIDRMPVRVLEFWLNLYKIPYSTSDSVAAKKIKLRFFKQENKNKGLAAAYLDIAEEITGKRGTITIGSDLTGWKWDSTGWDESWGDDFSRFVVYIDVKSTDDNELDEIQNLYRVKYLKPAFYQLYLTDKQFTILRAI